MTADAIGESEAVLPQIDAHDLALWVVTEPVVIIDVRNRSEREKRHIEESMHIPLSELHKRLSDIPKDRPIAVYCASGYRAQMAVSYLRMRGWTRIATVDDDEQHWAATLPTTSHTTQMAAVKAEA
jgi:rhodanese-related sulfurtransferase